MPRAWNASTSARKSSGVPNGGGRQLPVGEGAVALLGDGPPRPEVHLVDRHRRVHGVGRRPPLQPVGVLPLVGRRRDDARLPGRVLGREGERVRLEAEGALGGDELVLVAGPGPDAGEEHLPHTARPHRPHRVEAAVPPVEVADHPGRLGVGRPHRERRAGHPAVHADVGAEHLPQPLVAALADEVDVEVADRGPEPVRVVHGERQLAVRDLEAVLGHLGARHLDLEDPCRVDERHRHRRAVGQHDAGPGGVGAEGPDHDRAGTVGVGAEHGVGIRVLPGDQPLDRLLRLRLARGRSSGRRRLGRRCLAATAGGLGGRAVGGCHRGSSRRSTAARGMTTQSGRWDCS